MLLEVIVFKRPLIKFLNHIITSFMPLFVRASISTMCMRTGKTQGRQKVGRKVEREGLEREHRFLLDLCSYSPIVVRLSHFV